MISEAIYGICALTSAICVLLLARAYAKRKMRILAWSALAFAGLFLNNVLLFFDKIVFTNLDLSVLRIVPAVVGLGLLCYGMIWEAER